MKETIFALVRRSDQSLLLRIFYTNFILEFCQNYNMASAILQDISENEEELSLGDALRISWLKFRMNVLTKDMSNQTADQLLWKQEKKDAKFRKLILISTHLYARFWDLLSEESPSYDLFQSIGFELLKVNEQINVMWKKLSSCSTTKPSGHALIMFSNYTKYLQDNPVIAEEIAEEADASVSLKMGETDSPIVGILAHGDSIGIIQTINAAFSSLSGYTNEDLIGKEFCKNFF